MNVELVKIKSKKTYKDKKTGLERNIFCIALRIGNKYVLINPVFKEDYKVLDAFCEFVDLSKKD